MRYQAALRPDCSTNTADKTKFKGYIGYKFLINLIFNAIRDPMIVECPNCNKKFNLDKKLIPENGRSLKCSNCDHIWHYKTQITTNIDDLKIPKDKDTNLDTNSSEEKKDIEHNEGINDENFTDINQGAVIKENTEIEEDYIKDEKENEKKQGKIKMILIYLIVIIISLLGIIFLLDTFKSYISNVFPSITPLFNSFYETLLDFKLFIKDLTN